MSEQSFTHKSQAFRQVEQEAMERHHFPFRYCWSGQVFRGSSLLPPVLVRSVSGEFGRDVPIPPDGVSEVVEMLEMAGIEDTSRILGVPAESLVIRIDSVTQIIYQGNG